VAELKAANRSYLKKMSRLLEENVALQTVAAAAAAEAQAAVEAPAPPPVAPPPAAPPPAAEIPAELKESVARINDAISGFRTGLDVLGGLLPEILDRIPAADGDDTREQVAAALEDLGQMAKDLKVEAVKARKHL
jgi:cell wall-associated NlpC family hydrolase